MKRVYWVVIGIAGLSLALPFILTRSAIWAGFDFSQTGQIGDTIGGITAPILGLLSAILLFVSIKEQQKNNKIQSDQFRSNLMIAFYEPIIKNWELFLNDEDKIKTKGNLINLSLSYVEKRANNEDIGDIRVYIEKHLFDFVRYNNLLYLVLEIKDADLDEKTKSILLRKLAGYFLEPLDKGFVHAINSTLKIASQSKENIDKDDEFSYVIRFFNLIKILVNSNDTNNDLYKKYDVHNIKAVF
jgi:uncharacterized membrane protein